MKNLKSELSQYFPELGSSQLTEALAAALGFKTNAALRAEIRKHATIRFYCLLSEGAFDQKLFSPGDPALDDFIFEDVRTPEMLPTDCPFAYQIDYKSVKQKAWRNLIFICINIHVGYGPLPGLRRFHFDSSIGKLSTYLGVHFN